MAAMRHLGVGKWNAPQWIVYKIRAARQLYTLFAKVQLERLNGVVDSAHRKVLAPECDTVSCRVRQHSPFHR
jgi:hypothetical protein